jgi:dTDP-4-amino-4,6-dideoxygalactose transaminase
MSAIRLDVHPHLSPAVYVRRPAARLPFPLDQPGCRLFARARHGLWSSLKDLGVAPGDEVLAPAYHHGSEIEALRRAGMAARFYEATETLEPDEAELERLLGPRVRALHLIHYLGFPQDAPRWRAWCDERGLLLIEDAAQSWLSSIDGKPVGAFGDVAFFSLYKTVGLADGAAVISRGPPPPDNGRAGIGWRELGRHHRAWLAQYIPWAATLRLARGAPREYDPNEDFDLGDPRAACARTTPALLKRAGARAALERRRANYQVLLQAFGDHVPPPFHELPTGASPLYLPIQADDKAGVIARLAQHGVRGLDLWLIPHPTLPVEDFPQAARRRTTTVGLAVHQGLKPSQLERIVAAASASMRPPSSISRRRAPRHFHWK